MKCNECGNEMTSTTEDIKYVDAGLPDVTLEGIEVRRCPKCNEEEIVIPRIEELHRVIARALSMRAPKLRGNEIRFLRKHLGFSSSDFAGAVGVAPETVSRWENNREPMGSTAERLLRLMVMTRKPIEEYPLEQLAHVAAKDAPPAPRIALRRQTAGWKLEPVAV